MQPVEPVARNSHGGFCEGGQAQAASTARPVPTHHSCWLSMAQFGLSGACGVVLTGDTDIRKKNGVMPNRRSDWNPSFGARAKMLASQPPRRVVIDNKELLLKPGIKQRVVLIPC